MILLPKILTSYTFRFMSTYVASLSVASLVVMMLVYAAFSYDYFKDLRASVNDEANTLLAAFKEGGAEGVEALVEERTQNRELKRFFYLVVDKDFNKVAGNLHSWPKYKHYGEGWLSFQSDVLRWDGADIDFGFIARAQEYNGYYLLAARYQGDVVSHARLVGMALILSMAVTIVLGAIGGAIVAVINGRRLEVINKSIQRIMSGDLSERIDASDQQGETRALTLSINRVLDRVQMLMEGMRQVSDNIAHDLRTPLTRLRNQLTQLQEQVESENEETVQRLIDEADGLLSTFSALLRIAQVESGNRREAFTQVNPKIILLDVVELYEPLAADKSIAMTDSLEDGMLLNGDRDLLFQAFANLIDNAIKYTPENGSIYIGLKSSERGALFTIADSGQGIPEADRDRVFRRFYRVETSRSLQPGNGLGLSLVSAVIKIHHGEVQLLDNNPGLRVEVLLPFEG